MKKNAIILADRFPNLQLTQYPIVVVDLPHAHVNVLHAELDVEIVDVQVGLAVARVCRDYAPDEGARVTEARVERAVAARRQDDEHAGTARKTKLRTIS